MTPDLRVRLVTELAVYEIPGHDSLLLDLGPVRSRWRWQLVHPGNAWLRVNWESTDDLARMAHPKIPLYCAALEVARAVDAHQEAHR